MKFIQIVLIALLLGFISNSFAAPAKIVLLRHGEKENDYALCDVGQERSVALRAQFLGKNATSSIFMGNAPSAFFATTLHTLELIAPTANSWELPITTYPALPLKVGPRSNHTDLITQQTQLAASHVMQDPAWNGKTVVMVWEHKHIANQKLVKENPDALVDLRQLLKLDKLPENIVQKVPKTWSGSNYNFIWVIDYDAQGNPIGFNVVRQNFTGEFASIPNNDWGAKENLPPNSRCK